VTDYLTFTLDKFTFRVAQDRLYNRDGVWAKVEDGHPATQVRLGLSDFVQQRSGDIAFADVAEAGTKVAFDEAIADIETIKIDVELASPVAGKVIEVNPKMELGPEVINEDPYGDGWLALIEASDWPADRGRLLDPAAYLEQVKIEAREAFAR